MERQWKYQLSIDGTIIKAPTDGQLLQRTRETSYYNHLAAALQGLLQLNMYEFDSQFGQVGQEQKWNRLYNSACITSAETGQRVVSMLNLPMADNDRNPFLHPGLYLSFDIGIRRFERLAGLSLEPLVPMDATTARLARYEYGNRQVLVTTPGLADLEIAIAKKRDMEALELYRVSFYGQPLSPIYEIINHHFHNFPDSMSYLLSTDLRRLQPATSEAGTREQAIGWAQLDYGSKALPLASLIREDRSKDKRVLPGAYIFTTSAPSDIERHAGVDLSGLPVYQNGNLYYLRIASLDLDGKTLRPTEPFLKVRDSLLPPGQAPYSIHYHYQPAKESHKAQDTVFTNNERTFSTLYTAMIHFLAVNKAALSKPFLDYTPLSSIELIDNRQHKTVGHLFHQKTATGQLAAGYHLQIDPAYLTKAFREIESPLKRLQRDKDYHIILSPFAEKASLKKNSPATNGRRKPPPPAGGKTI